MKSAPAKEPREHKENDTEQLPAPSSRHPIDNALLCEVSWEVCQQLGGIYTVIRSKAPTMVKQWDRRYCMVGPYNPQLSPAEFEQATPTGPFGKVVKEMQKLGVEAYYGYWLITGRPHVVLLNPRSVFSRLKDIKYLLWEHHGISTVQHDPLVDEVVAFGSLIEDFFRLLGEQEGGQRPIVAHFHEWMAASAIPCLRRRKMPVGIVFTTHATQLGRYLAMSDQNYYEHMTGLNWREKARNFNIEAKVLIERAAAHGCHVMTTVSEVTGAECEHILDRKPDILLPNGLNIERFAAVHEFQNMHRMYKEKIHQFVIGHFFQCYPFDLDKTLYMFTSGRYEYGNKGFDIAIETMARLNWRLKQEKSKTTVVFFIITKAAIKSILADVLKTRAVMEEIRHTCDSIQKQIGDRLFVAAAMGGWPRLEDLVDDYWRLRLRRTLYAWKTRGLPPIVTHELVYDGTDPILNQLRSTDLINKPDDPVKVVFHPDFITSSNPLFGMDYDQFVRGCHLGIFPSTYEPWGYAPMECVALGLPSITTDLTGFGTYVSKNIQDNKDHGILVAHRRRRSYDAAANQMTDWISDFTRLERRDRITLRNAVESVSGHFDWSNLGRHYREAHILAIKRQSK